MDYKESLEHMFNVGMLNAKGMKDYIKILRNEVSESKLKMIDLESTLQMEILKHAKEVENMEEDFKEDIEKDPEDDDDEPDTDGPVEPDEEQVEDGITG